MAKTYFIITMLKILPLIFLLLFSGCAGTSYRKATSWTPYGYSDTKKSNNTYYITFKASNLTTLEKVEDYTLLRSAEVTIENDYKYFKIDSGKSTYIQHTINSCANGICTPIPINTPTAFNAITCFKEKTKGKDIIYDAKIIVDKIRLKYEIE